MRPLLILLFAALLTIAHGRLFISVRGEALEQRFVDYWFSMRGEIAPPADVVLVAMDEESYRNLGLSRSAPWPRALHAKLLRRLKSLGVKGVVFDVLFLGPGSSPEANAELAAALGDIQASIGMDFGDITQYGGTGKGLITPYEVLSAHVSRVSFVALPEDEGRLRRFSVPTHEMLEGYKTLAETGAFFLLGKDVPRPSPRDFVNYYGPAGTIPTFSYYQVVDDASLPPAELFKGKIVYVGLVLRADVGAAQKDSFITSFPSRGRTFGVEIHATSALNLIHDQVIKRAKPALELAWLSLYVFIAGALLAASPPLRGLVIFAVLEILWIIGAYLSFRHEFFVPGACANLIVLPAALLVTTIFSYVIVRRAQRQIRRAFAFYLSPEMARSISKGKGAVKLGGEEVIATALFTDIVGFTKMSETMKASDLTVMLNSYFTEVMRAVFEKEGTLIKFIGDAVFALWGAPVKVGDHAARACEAALRIEEEVAHFNASGRFPPCHTKVGINTGNMVVGNLGATQRFDFTAIGDAVNLASRLEGLNRQFGTNILISEFTHAELNSSFNTLRVGAVQVAGKSEIVNLYTVLTRPLADNALLNFEAALAALRGRRWDQALEIFIKAAQADEKIFGLCEFYKKQISIFKAVPPAADWQGEVKFSMK